MAKEVRIHLTPAQKAKIKSATGKTMAEIRVSSVGKNLSAKFSPKLIAARQAVAKAFVARQTVAKAAAARGVTARQIGAKQTTARQANTRSTFRSSSS